MKTEILGVKLSMCMILENELEKFVSENEFKRRTWLMNWQMEVVEMQNDLYEMQQTLEKSLVRRESAKKREKAEKLHQEVLTAAQPQMSECDVTGRTD